MKIRRTVVPNRYQSATPLKDSQGLSDPLPILRLLGVSMKKWFCSTMMTQKHLQSIPSKLKDKSRASEASPNFFGYYRIKWWNFSYATKWWKEKNSPVHESIGIFGNRSIESNAKNFESYTRQDWESFLVEGGKIESKDIMYLYMAVLKSRKSESRRAKRARNFLVAKRSNEWICSKMLMVLRIWQYCWKSVLKFQALATPLRILRDPPGGRDPPVGKGRQIKSIKHKSIRIKSIR